MLLILVAGGVGGALSERLVLPYLLTLSPFRRFAFFAPQAPLVITKREEIRIDEGINQRKVASELKNALVRVYVHEGQIGSPKFRLAAAVSGVVVTSDGIIAAPAAANFRPEFEVTVVFSEGASELFPAVVIGADELTGLAFLKIDRQDLPVAKQGFSAELQVGERALAVWTTAVPAEVATKPVTISSRSLPWPSLTTTYKLNDLNAMVRSDGFWELSQLGAVIVNKDAFLVGVLTQIDENFLILRSEDLKLALDNFLANQKVVWPQLRLSYRILGETETKLLGLPKKYGILIESGPVPLRENDFVFAVGSEDLDLNNSFQQKLLQAKPGEKLKLKLLRNGQEREVQITL